MGVSAYLENGVFFTAEAARAARDEMAASGCGESPELLLKACAKNAALRPEPAFYAAYIAAAAYAGNLKPLFYLSACGTYADGAFLRALAGELLKRGGVPEEDGAFPLLCKKYPAFYRAFSEALCASKPLRALKLAAANMPAAAGSALRPADYVFFVSRVARVSARSDIGAEEKMRALREAAPARAGDAARFEALHAAFADDAGGDAPLRVRRLSGLYAKCAVSHEDALLLREEYRACAAPAPEVTAAYASFAAGRGALDEALALYDTLAADPAYTLSSCRARAELAMQAGRTLAALKYLKAGVRALSPDPDDEDSRVILSLLCRCLVTKGDGAKAKGLLPRLNFYCRGKEDTHFNTARAVYEAEGDAAALEELYARHIEETRARYEGAEKPAPSACLAYAGALARAGKLPEAGAVYEKAFETARGAVYASAGEDIAAAAACAEFFSETGADDKAGEYRLYVLRNAPARPFRRGAAEIIAGAEGAAAGAAYFRRYAEGARDMAVLREYFLFLTDTGLASPYGGEPIYVADAEKCVAVAEAENPEAPAFYVTKARAQLAAGRPGEAARLCDKALTATLFPLEALAVKGYALEQLKQFSGALEVYASYMAFMPDKDEKERARVRNRLTSLYFRFGRDKDALKLYQGSAGASVPALAGKGGAGSDGRGFISILPFLRKRNGGGKPASRMVLLQGGVGDQIRESALLEALAEEGGLTVVCDERVKGVIEATYPGAGVMTAGGDAAEGVPDYLRAYGFSAEALKRSRECDDILTTDDLILRFLKKRENRRVRRLKVPAYYEARIDALFAEHDLPEDVMHAGIVWRSARRDGKAGGYGLRAAQAAELIRKTAGKTVWHCLQPDITPEECAILDVEAHFYRYPGAGLADDPVMLAALIRRLDRILTFDRAVADIAAAVGTETFFHEEAPHRTNGAAPLLADERSTKNSAVPALRRIAPSNDESAVYALSDGAGEAAAFLTYSAESGKDS